MSLEKYFRLGIHYDIRKDEFTTEGDFNARGEKEIIHEFLRGQIGAGEDDRKPKERDTYDIELRWYCDNDAIEARCNTGNKGLRDGILWHYLENLKK